MKRLIEILIVVAALLIVAFVFGCKDEAEAYEPEECRGITIEDCTFEEIDSSKSIKIEGWDYIDEPNEHR